MLINSCGIWWNGLKKFTNIQTKFVLAVCDIRLDFEQFTTNAPALTTEISGGLCQDILTITTNTGQAIPEICGMNSGQHGKNCFFILNFIYFIVNSFTHINFVLFSLFGFGTRNI